MIGVCIPAHDEAQLIGACLASVYAAAQYLSEEVRVVVVADACTDRTAAIAHDFGCDVVTIDARCVGAARAAGAEHLLRLGARWLCNTDADSRVPPLWIATQLACGADAVCGTVGVDDWTDQPPQVEQAFLAQYSQHDGHRHIHGANLGVDAGIYRRAGGFAALATHEDVHLVDALRAIDARIAWVLHPQVTTSSRAVARAPHGFAAWLGAQHPAHCTADPILLPGVEGSLGTPLLRQVA